MRMDDGDERECEAASRAEWRGGGVWHASLDLYFSSQPETLCKYEF